ncbi:MAG: LysR family transcriptional regulator [Deltaproteobacteria bacterium]|nr:MAG: LysR family transcriptional regulator [Deltaproteobacteria bacterium]
MDTTLTLDQLVVLSAVVEHGSFSAAGRALRRAQSGVSYAIANLEDALGVSLFDRSGHAPRLTEAGAALLTDARAVLDRVGRLEGRARALAAGVETEVALAIDAMVPLDVLAEVSAAFRVAWPEVTLRVYTEALGGVMARVMDGSARLGVTSEVGSPERLDSAPVAEVALVAVAAAGHPLAQRSAPLDDAAFADEVQIVLSERGVTTPSADVNVLSACTWRVADLATKHALVRAGLGWGTLPEHLVADDLASGTLVAIAPASWGSGARRATLYSVTRVDRPPGPAGAWLRAALHSVCSAQRERADSAP